MADTRYLARRPAADAPWPLAELVRAQCMACEGAGYEVIADALGRSTEDVRRRLDPAPAPRRAEFAGVGYQHIKRR
jgi:hypothetical protein